MTSQRNAAGVTTPTAPDDRLRSTLTVPHGGAEVEGDAVRSSTLNADADEVLFLIGCAYSADQLDLIAEHSGGRVVSTAATAEQVAGAVLNLGLELSGYDDVWILGHGPAHHFDAVVDRLVSEVADEDHRPVSEVRRNVRVDYLPAGVDVHQTLKQDEAVTDTHGAHLFGPESSTPSGAAPTAATTQRDELLIADKTADLRERLDARERPPTRRRSLVKGQLDRGDLGFIAGPPGEGKTATAVELACAVATGTPFAGRRTKQGRVLFLAGEGEQATLDRIRAWEIAHLPPDERIPFDQLQVLPGAEDLRTPRNVASHAMARLITELEPVLVLVDTLNKYTAGINENDAGDVSAFIKVCDTIRRGPSSPNVAILHHTPKSGGDLRGSSVLRGAADYIFLCSKDAEGFDVETLKQRNRKEDPVGRFTMVSVEWTEPVQADEVEPDDFDDDEFIVDDGGTARRVSSIRVMWDMFGPAAVGLPKRREYPANSSGKALPYVVPRPGFTGLDESTLTPGRQMFATVVALGGDLGLREPEAQEAFRALKGRNNSKEDAAAAWTEARKHLVLRREGSKGTRFHVPKADSAWTSETAVKAASNRLAEHQNAAPGGMS